MISFLRLWNNIQEVKTSHGRDEEQEGPLLTSGEESQAMEAIRNGLNLRKPDCGDFWEDFITVSGNADAMSELLEVPREKVTNWASKITELVDKVKEDEDQDGNKKKGIIPTAHEPTGDVAGVDSSRDGPADTQPYTGGP